MSETFNFDDLVNGITAHELKPIVQKALQRQGIELGQWHRDTLMGAGGGIGNSAVYRFAGSCVTDGESCEWSLILKIVRSGEDDNVSSNHYWKREFEAYQSGWLNNLSTPSLRAPICYHAEMTDQAIVLWLEDVAGPNQKWDRHSLATAARHLGQFNGTYLTQDVQPDYPWFSKNWIRQDFENASKFIPRLGTARPDTFLSRVITPDRKAKCHAIFNEIDILLTTIDKLPKTIQHLDAFSQNLFPSNDNGQESTIAIDWAFVGREAVGAELASLFWVTLFCNEIKATDAADYERDIFENYMDGLKDAGYQPDRQSVRLGFTASTGLRHFGDMCYVTQLAPEEEVDPEWVEQWLTAGRHIDMLTQEARQLINAIT